VIGEGEGATQEPWDDRPKDHCGLVGVASHRDVSADIFIGLRVLQHRGQESAGIAVYNGAVLARKGMGLVHEVFTPNSLTALKGPVGIGHVRYSTTGTSVIDNAQPIVSSSVLGDVALAHNGDIVNAGELREELEAKGWSFITSTDSEVIVRLLANEIAKTKDATVALKNFTAKLVGAYSLVILIGGRLFAVRDPLAIRPLCLGRTDDSHIVASESVVFDTLGAKFVRDLRPGEVLEVKPDEVISSRLPHPTNTAHCMFEWVYFSRPDSQLDGRQVYDVRVRIGEELAKLHPVEADVIVPVPDSGRAHAYGFSRVSGIPTAEGLIKNRYIERTFIMPNPSDRELGVMLKLNPIRSVIEGKRVVLIDDSIVRGTTIRQIVRIVRDGGAREVHVRVGCPPIIAPCYLGIDMKTRNQFVATGRSVEEISEFIGADSLGYLSVEALVRALGVAQEDLCLACLTAEYPVEIPGERFRPQRRLDVFMEEPKRPLEARGPGQGRV
jgi:amidophosphoribosyltransferase